MTRVYVICEGQTEELFVKEVLSTFFLPKAIYLTPILIGKPGHKGGNFTFRRLLADIRPLLGDSTAFCTTLFDFYGLPNDFPGKDNAQLMKNTEDKAECIIKALSNALTETMSVDTLRRFIPYIQMYEFEGLLFSDCRGLAIAINQPHLTTEFEQIRCEFSSPEDINDSPITAPSKRIRTLYPAYDKPVHGSLAIMEIGIGNIRKECSLFDQWLQQIEALSETT
jgi:hypothetical protein